ncbi:ABC transporter substrate-binding protein [Motiliproteus sp. MSK22-1]|uniref:substrate-binding periplasmic protein n=1 Tax=Motiliproteus sp. MSK22-1 TaxID=1897630 RepID=UPI00097874EB|nr:ABC transporter substrate-binding protein [Motiliproteus sp. MSK22-1]OMH26712.1 hypothetical protein BGP75_22915 [Motiliproteus sp. MSK22-1]
MIFLRSLFICLSLLISSIASGQTVQEITWMTEEYPPLNYTKNGLRKGIFVEVLVEIWKKLGIEASADDIQVLPWARSYRILESTPGTALFAMSRTEGRESLFKWVGPINITPIGIIAKKSKNFNFQSIEQINQRIPSGKLGVVRSDSGEHYFLDKAGSSELIDYHPTGELLIKMLDKDRVEAISYSYGTALFLMRDNNIDSSEYSLVYPLTEQGQGWFGFNRETNPKTIVLIQKALDELIVEGVIEKIQANYR